MIGFQANIRGNTHQKTRTFGAAAFMCLVLLALLTVVQVAHIHSLDTDADHCSLCIAMHSAAPVAVMAAAIILIKIGTSASVVEVRAVVRYWHPKLYTRPPPSSY